MPLATFSAILGFAIQAEESAGDALSRTLASAPEAGREALGRIQAESQRSLKTLRTILRENVTEMVMEPCEAIDEAAYAFQAVSALPGSGALKGSLVVLEKQRDFLRRAACVVNLAEVKRSLERIADRKNQLITEISEHA